MKFYVMRNIIVFMILGLFMISCIAPKQPIKINNIKIDFTNYIEALNQKKFTQSIDYFEPTFFKLVSREELMNVLEEFYNSPDSELKMTNLNYMNFGEAKVVENITYVIFEYSKIMQMRVRGKENETAEDKEYRVKLSADTYNDSFGAKNVSYNSRTDFFEVYSEEKVLAVSSNGKVNWKFIVLDDEYIDIFKSIVPEEVLVY